MVAEFAGFVTESGPEVATAGFTRASSIAAPVSSWYSYAAPVAAHVALDAASIADPSDAAFVRIASVSEHARNAVQ